MQNQKGRKNGGKHSHFQRGSKSYAPQSYSVSNFNLSRQLYFLPLVVFFLIGLFSCGNPSSQTTDNNVDTNQNTDSQLTFFGVALEQFDEQGRPIWKVNAKQAKYTKETEIGEAKNPDGVLYQDGKIVYKIKAETADIKQDGKQLLLKGKIIAQDPNNGVILRGNELEWRPEEDLLIVRNQFNGSHKQLKATAQEARVKTREQRVEFSGKVIATAADPQLIMQTEHLIWEIKQEKLIGDRPIKIDHYKDNKIANRGQGNGAEINLKTKIANLQPKAQLQLLNPPMQITSNSMTWDINQENVKTNSPVRVVHQQENVIVTGNKAEMKIPQNIVNITGNVNAVGKNRQSLKSNQMQWDLDKKLLEAQGNVVYRQVEPPLNFQGATAIGNLETENIVVKGGSSGQRVITEIIPQDGGF
jgi:LPS export ABC transporter protein LptC